MLTVLVVHVASHPPPAPSKEVSAEQVASNGDSIASASRRASADAQASARESRIATNTADKELSAAHSIAAASLARSSERHAKKALKLGKENKSHAALIAQLTSKELETTRLAMDTAKTATLGAKNLLDVARQHQAEVWKAVKQAHSMKRTSLLVESKADKQNDDLKHEFNEKLLLKDYTQYSGMITAVTAASQVRENLGILNKRRTKLSQSLYDAYQVAQKAFDESARNPSKESTTTLKQVQEQARSNQKQMDEFDSKALKHETEYMSTMTKLQAEVLDTQTLDDHMDSSAANKLNLLFKMDIISMQAKQHRLALENHQFEILREKMEADALVERYSELYHKAKQTADLVNTPIGPVRRNA